MPDLDTHPQTYALGFLTDGDHVVLVAKNRPSWQAGKLNGVGGKVEDGETPTQAMRREFREEAGIDIATWDEIAQLSFDGGIVHVFRSFTHRGTVRSVRTCTDEAIVVRHHHEILSPGTPIIPNLSWLIPLALYRHDTYDVIEVRERPPS